LSTNFFVDPVAAGIFHIGLNRWPGSQFPLNHLEIGDCAIHPRQLTYFVARGIVPQRAHKPGMMLGREKLFAFL